MKNQKINLPLFICCFLVLLLFNSFNSKLQQECSTIIKQWNSLLNKKADIRGALPKYENCVSSFSNNNLKREEFLSQAYFHLGKYYLSQDNVSQALLYKSLERQENRK
jgi:hypothetical protein